MIDERALQAAIPVGSNMANADLVRAIIEAYEAARSAEPVAWMVDSKLGRRFYLCEQKALEPEDRQIPLYAHPKEAPDV